MEMISFQGCPFFKNLNVGFFICSFDFVGLPECRKFYLWIMDVLSDWIIIDLDFEAPNNNGKNEKKKSGSSTFNLVVRKEMMEI